MKIKKEITTILICLLALLDWKWAMRIAQK
jgi:hypothetical protein